MDSNSTQLTAGPEPTFISTSSDAAEPGEDASSSASWSVSGTAAASADGSSSGGGPAASGDSSPETSEPSADTSDSSARLRAVPVGSTGLGMGFWEYLPPDYDAAAVPLLVFTHGAAWQGAGTEQTLPKLLEVGPPNLISTDNWPNSRPFLVLAPQNPHSGCFTSADISALYEYALATYNVDAKRIYLTGQSCGAIGAWNYLAEHLDQHVTAAVLISGDGRAAFEQAGCELGKVAIWGLHNAEDGTVSSQGTSSPIDALLQCNPTPDARVTIYPGETAHDAWTKTYDTSAGHDIYNWLLAHAKP